LKDFNIISYNDSLKNGNSEIIKLNYSKNLIEFSFLLKDKYSYPFCGLAIYNSHPSFIDISRYDTIKIIMKADNATRVQIMRRDFVPGISSPSDDETLVPLVKEITVSKEWQTYSISFDKLKTPDWFFDNLAIDREKLEKTGIHYFTGVNFQSGVIRQFNEKITYYIHEIRFEKNPIIFILLTLIFAFILMIFNILPSMIGKGRAVFTGAKPLILKLHSREENSKIMSYMNEHYYDPDISLGKIRRDTGVSGNKITKIIYKISGLPFKKYLNYLRMEEAKRQLALTDRSVMEIAMMLGYNNTTHFNRIFKEFEKSSPSDYRKNHYRKNRK
jgi:AraC-like DNA-binding protein